MRGENIQFRLFFSLYFGTPPHAWGKLQQIAINHSNSRYTPTCVGKTLRGASLGMVSEVHPHMRGENQPRLESEARQYGTPPHAWGKHTSSDEFSQADRYTPTCVGKTLPGQ